MAKANHEIAEMVLKVLESEATARLLQQRLLAMPGLDSADVYKVRETSSDESNHALLYEAMYVKYSGGIYAAPDGAKNAISEITSGIGSDDAKTGQ